jgi:hypothetical protein
MNGLYELMSPAPFPFITPDVAGTGANMELVLENGFVEACI